MTGQVGEKEESARLSFGVLGLLIVLAFFVASWWNQPTDLADSTADWLTVRAANGGVDPYQSVLDLATRYQIQLLPAGSAELGSFAWVHPRLPGALLLLEGTQATDVTGTFRAILLLSALSFFILLVWVTPAVSGIDRTMLLLWSPLLLVSVPVFGAFEFGTVSLLVAVFIWLAWMRVRGSDSVWAGMFLALAITLKIWPAFLLLPLSASRRWRAVGGAVATTGVLNLAGFAVLGIDPNSSTRALSVAASTWIRFSPNGSLVGWFAREGFPLWTGVPAALVLVGLVLWVWKREPEASWMVAVAGALLIAPLSWAHYDVALIPVAVWAVERRGVGRLGGATWLLLSEFGLLVRYFDQPTFSFVGIVAMVSRLALLVGVLAAVMRSSAAKESTGSLGEVN